MKFFRSGTATAHKIKDTFFAPRAMDRLVEEKLYEMIAEELSRDEKRVGLWTKALGNAEGDEGKVEGLYIEYRLQSMKDEATVLEAVIRAVEEEKKKKMI